MENRNEMEIDLLGLLLHLKTKIWIILLVTVGFAIGGYSMAKREMKPVYTATTSVYVYQKNTTPDGSTVAVDTNTVNLATMLRRDCAIIISGENVTSLVIEKLNLQTTPAALSSAISVYSDDNTRILKLSYTDSDPQRAVDVINTVREVAADQIYKIMNVEAVNTIFEATEPTVQYNISVKKQTSTAAMLGAVLSAVVLIVIFLLDDTIRTEDDVDNHLGLSTLAAIPVSADLRVNRASKKRSRSRRNTKTKR